MKPAPTTRIFFYALSFFNSCAEKFSYLHLRRVIQINHNATQNCAFAKNARLNRAAHNTSRASSELPADTQPHGTMGSPKAQRAHDRHEIGRQANRAGIPTPRNDGPPQSSTRARHSARPGAGGLPASTQAQRSSGTPAPLTPRTHNFSHSFIFPSLNQQACTLQLGQHAKLLSVKRCDKVRQTAQHTSQAGHQANSPPTPSDTEREASLKLNVHLTDSRTPGDLLAGIPTPRNDGSPPKLDAGTAQCTARRQRSPRQHTGLAEQRDSPRRSRRTRRAHDVSTPAQVVSPP